MITYSASTNSYTDTRIPLVTGAGYSFDMAGKYPLLDKRIWETKKQAQDFVDNLNDSAIAGLILTVTADTADNNGAYWVAQIADGTHAKGELVHMTDASSASTSVTVSALTEDQTTSGYLKSYQVYQNGQPVGVKIDIPKDFLVKRGHAYINTTDTSIPGAKYTDDPTIGSGHTYLEFEINVLSGTSANTDYVRVDMNSLVDDFEVDNSNSATSKVILSLTMPTDGTKRKLSASLMQLSASDISATTISATSETVEISGDTVAEQLKSIGIQIKKASNSSNISGTSAVKVESVVDDTTGEEVGKKVSLVINSGDTGSIFEVYDDGLGLASGATWDCGEW